jgi:hypothetical protein
LTPATSASLTLGEILPFTATAQNAANGSVRPTFTFQSSDTSILNLTPTGVACAGRWDATFTICTPQGIGVVQVTASALGATSPPTLVFVHPAIDNITVTEVPPSPPLAIIQPCIAQNQTMMLQATAWSQGVDVTASVGAFTWSATNSTVVTITPIENLTYNIPTNQSTVKANLPGLAQIFAFGGGVTSTPFQQMTPLGSPADLVWDFFETCPVQNITLQLGPAGSQQSGQTSFAVNKGTPETATAIVTDVLGNILSKVPLTWTASQPKAVSAGTACTAQTCSIGTSNPGAGIVTASCTPPTCNIGFPLVPPGLAPSSACAQVLGIPSCEPFIPVPVYASTAISGLVEGTPIPTSVLATSLGCAADFLCTVGLYNISTSKESAGNPSSFLAPPNSLLFDVGGDKAYMGSNFGVSLVNPGNLGGTSSAFTAIGTITGKLLAVSNNGNFAVFSDTVHTPNQVFVVNETSSGSPAITPFSISGATSATFSPDGMKALIVGPSSSTCPSAGCLYIYSTQQALQTIPLSVPASSVAFSSTGAFAFLNGGSTSSTVTTFSTCDNSFPTLPINLPPPIFLRLLPPGSPPPPVAEAGLETAGLDVLIGLDNTGLDLIATNSTSPALGTQQSPATLCPQSIALASNPTTHKIFSPLHIDLGQGTFNPINFFVSPDGSQVYIVASDRSIILVYNFNTNSVSGIPLVGNATPLSADITVDGTLIYVAGSDGTLHQVSIASGVDLIQIQFPPLTDFENPFCNPQTPPGPPCPLNLVAVRPD